MSSAALFLWSMSLRECIVRVTFAIIDVNYVGDIFLSVCFYCVPCFYCGSCLILRVRFFLGISFRNKKVAVLVRKLSIVGRIIYATVSFSTFRTHSLNNADFQSCNLDSSPLQRDIM